MIEAFSTASRHKDPFEAGRDAASRAMARLSNRPPDIIWAFGSVCYDQERLLDGIGSVAGNTPIIGCSTDGEISSSGLSTESVVVMAMASDAVSFHTTVVTALSKDSHEAGVQIGRSFSGKACRYLQLFSDGLTGNAVKIIEGITSVLGENVLIAGGAAGDGGQFVKTYQYHGCRPYTDSITAVAFEGDFALGTSVGCGWFPVGTAKQVTKSEGNILYELDGQPALPIYERFLGRYASQLPAVGVEYPLGLVDDREAAAGDDDFICRATMGVDREKQSIRFAGEIPRGSMVKMTMGNENDLLEAAREAARGALEEMIAVDSAVQPAAIFLYSCMARRIVLGSRTPEEVEAIRKIAGETVPIVGFYTYGEFAPAGRRKRSCFHNETVTMSIIGC